MLEFTLWILDSRYWIPDSMSVSFRLQIPIFSGIPDSLNWITDSKARDSGIPQVGHFEITAVSRFLWEKGGPRILAYFGYTPESIRGKCTSFRCNDFWGVWVDKRYLWLVNGCLEHHRPIITNACSPKRSQKSLRRKLVPIPLIVSGVWNCLVSLDPISLHFWIPTSN